ncbi:diguanylate cyclase [Chitinibacter sp. FCG-7]|uniref:diguanylate cyclase n=1 Tax=Chitinibacter mangrovi TaxID=3153927 RepID=A0AAU7F4H7_9NEIS
MRRETEDAMEKLAKLDGLTGIANRRTFDEALNMACREAVRNNSGLTLAMLDVDFFKQFNDHYGHSAGDEALRAVACAIAESARRPYDVAARYGGEEFALLLPGCLDAANLLERLRLSVLDLAIPHAHSTVQSVISVSIGALCLTGEECQPDSLLRKADELLYAAKHAGRNRVMWLSATERAN